MHSVKEVSNTNTCCVPVIEHVGLASNSPSVIELRPEHDADPDCSQPIKAQIPP